MFMSFLHSRWLELFWFLALPCAHALTHAPTRLHTLTPTRTHARTCLPALPFFPSRLARAMANGNMKTVPLGGTCDAGSSTSLLCGSSSPVSCELQSVPGNGTCDPGWRTSRARECRSSGSAGDNGEPQVSPSTTDRDFEVGAVNTAPSTVHPQWETFFATLCEEEVAHTSMEACGDRRLVYDGCGVLWHAVMV